MMTFRRLWTGDLPLETAFWSYAAFGGIVVNSVTTGASLILVSMEQTLAALLVGYGIAIPYNGLATVGVWRADHDHLEPEKVAVYRGVTLVGMFILCLT